MKWDIDLSVPGVGAKIIVEEDYLELSGADTKKLNEVHDYLQPVIKQFGTLFMMSVVGGLKSDILVEILMKKLHEAHQEMSETLGAAKRGHDTKPKN